ncbi:hypothetical protein FO519_009330 [Halicephalobus sp. NKZ332]|nr:hypothetical protein FO519_009330 [Halicephalobus sp. NKZ332]
MGNCNSRRSGVKIFGYYPCYCVEPILMDRVPMRCVGMTPNSAMALRRYLKLRKQKKCAKREGMTFCAKCKGYTYAPDHLFYPHIPEVRNPYNHNQQFHMYSDQPPPPYQEKVQF